MADLQDLLVDREELDRKLLAEILRPYVGIDAVRQEIVPKEDWRGLNSEAKALVFLLARRAMVAMPEVPLEVEGALPREITAETGVKGGTLRPKLRAMAREGLLSQDSSGRYLVPTYAVLRAKKVILGGGRA